MGSIQPATFPGLYMHVPFCFSKCPYCAFYSIPSSSLIPRWIHAIKKEAHLYKDLFERFDTLYVGGGTPSFLEDAELGTIMDTVFSVFDFDENAEITIEANPGDMTPSKSRTLKDLGFNRISLGIQSFNNDVLKYLGRNHTAETALNAFRNIRDGGFQNVSLDFIYGIEHESEDSWLKTLEKAVFFQPEHLSCYQLTFENKTPFKRRMEKGQLQSLDNHKESVFFELTSQLLEDNGYHHYEISSFSREINLFSQHNSKYWHHAPYLGLGPSSHSFNGSRRYWNVRSVRKYCDMLEAEHPPIAGHEDLSSGELRFEKIFLGLRTKLGFREDCLNGESRRKVAEFMDAGLLILKTGRIIPTRKGFLVADYLASCLSEDLD